MEKLNGVVPQNTSSDSYIEDGSKIEHGEEVLKVSQYRAWIKLMISAGESTESTNLKLIIFFLMKKKKPINFNYYV